MLIPVSRIGVVGSYISRTYETPNNYVLTPPTELFDWGAVSKTYTNSGSAVAGSAVPGGPYMGQNTAIKLSYHASLSSVTVTGLNLNLTNLKNFLLPVYRHPGAGPATFQVQITASAFSTYIAFDLIVDDIGWGLYAIPREAYSRQTEDYSSSPFVGLRIRERNQTSYVWPQGAGDTYFGNPMVDAICRPKWMIGYDDSKSSLLSHTVNGKTCISIMTEYGFQNKGTLYALPYRHGQTTFASDADVLSLYHDYGWTIGSHSASHPTYDGKGLRMLGPEGVAAEYDNSSNHPTRQPTNDDTAIYDDIMEGVQSVIDLGIPESHALHFALPQGGWDINVMTAVKRSGVLTCRGISTNTHDYRRVPAGLSTGRNRDPRTLPPMLDLPGSVQIDANEDRKARIKQAIDDAIASGGTGTSYCHQLHTDAIANKEYECAYLREKVDEGLIDVVTLHEWQKGIITT